MLVRLEHRLERAIFGGCLKESIGIRRAVTEDVSDIANVERASIAALEGFDLKDWPALIAAPGTFSYLAEQSHPFGVVCVGAPHDKAFEDGETGEVLAWHLDPAFWGQGLGRKLLVHGLTVIKRRAFERALIWIPETATKAIQTVSDLQFDVQFNREAEGISHLMFTRSLEDYF